MKGTAVPTTVCVNEVVGGFAPFPEDDTVALKAGDLVKIDCGCQIDGYASTLAHSFVVGGAAEGRAGDVVVAAHQALEAAIRLLKPGGKTSEVTEVLAKVAADFKVNVVSGVLSHNVTKGVIDGKKVVLNRPDFDQKVDDSEFALYDVYHLDVVFSTGEGKVIIFIFILFVLRGGCEDHKNKNKTKTDFLHIAEDKV
jgi:methionine aminopeptidase